MSAQLLICKFAVFTCVSLFFTDASRDSHGSQARSLSRPKQKVVMERLISRACFSSETLKHASVSVLCFFFRVYAPNG